MARQIAACGTISGYRRHTRLNERPCADCTEANREYARAYKKPCSYPGCNVNAHTGGMCRGHNQQLNGTTAAARSTRLPFAPLEEHLKRRHANDSHVGRYYGRQNTRVYAEACGVHISAYQRWKTDGLTIRAADRAAVHLGTLPLFIWGDAFYADLPQEELVA